MTTSLIPLQDTVRVTIDELTHMTAVIPPFMDSEYIMRVAGLSMELIQLQAILAMECDAIPPVNQMVDQIKDVLELTTERLAVRHAAQKNMMNLVGTSLH